MLQVCRSDQLTFGGGKFSCETVSTTYTAMQRINDKASHSIRSALFNRVNPDRVTLCGTPPPGIHLPFSRYWRIIVFSQQAENQHYFDYFEEAPYILTMNRIIVTHSLSLLNSNLESLTGSLRQDFRLRVHANRAFPPILILRTFESTQLAFHADRNRTCQ